MRAVKERLARRARAKAKQAAGNLGQTPGTVAGSGVATTSAAQPGLAHPNQVMAPGCLTPALTSTPEQVAAAATAAANAAAEAAANTARALQAKDGSRGQKRQDRGSAGSTPRPPAKLPREDPMDTPEVPPEVPEETVETVSCYLQRIWPLNLKQVTPTKYVPMPKLPPWSSGGPERGHPENPQQGLMAYFRPGDD